MVVRAIPRSRVSDLDPAFPDWAGRRDLRAAILAIDAGIALSGLLHEFVEKPAEKWLRPRGALWLCERQRSLGYTTQINRYLARSSVPLRSGLPVFG